MNEIRFTTTKSGSKNYNEITEHRWDLKDTIDIEDILRMKEFSKFKLAATIVKDDSAAGYKIQLEKEFIDVPFVIYILTKCGRGLKGGKSKNSLDKRSYPAGTEESWTMRGTPSVTNYVWSQIFRESLEDGCPVQFYGYAVPAIEHTYESFDGQMVTELTCGHYETEEKKLNRILNQVNGKKMIGEGNLLAKNKK